MMPSSPSNTIGPEEDRFGAGWRRHYWLSLEVGVLTALDELAGRALSNDFDVYVGTSAGAVLAACSPMVLRRRKKRR